MMCYVKKMTFVCCVTHGLCTFYFPTEIEGNRENDISDVVGKMLMIMEPIGQGHRSREGVYDDTIKK